ncbi:hypothetical protein JCM17960_11890 [Magnetospira thiophila]
MKVAKLVSKLNDVLDRDGKKKKKEALKKVLKKMKDKEVALQKKLEHCDSDKDRSDIERQIKVSKAQRQKGIKALRALKGKG